MRSANLMLWMQRHSVAGMSSGLILWILVGIIIVVGAGSSPCASGYYQAGWSALELCLLIKCFLFWLHSSWWCIPKIPVSPSTWSSRLHLLLRVSLVFTKANGRLAVHMYQHYMGRPHVVHLFTLVLLFIIRPNGFARIYFSSGPASSATTHLYYWD